MREEEEDRWEWEDTMEEGLKDDEATSSRMHPDICIGLITQ